MTGGCRCSVGGLMIKTGNEIEVLFLKAARGGGLPLGAAEDLCAAARYLDLNAVRCCPVECGLALAVPAALDQVIAGHGPQEVSGDAAVIAAFLAAAEAAYGRAITVEPAPDGVVIHGLAEAKAAEPALSRREVPEALLTHLEEMAARLLVPETDASRAAGAGAGLTDND